MSVKARIQALEKQANTKAKARRGILPIMGGLADRRRGLTPEEVELLRLNNCPIPICVQADFNIKRYLNLL